MTVDGGENANHQVFISSFGKSPAKSGNKKGLILKRLSLIVFFVIAIAFTAYKVFNPGNSGDFKNPAESEGLTNKREEKKTDQAKPTVSQSGKQDSDKNKRSIEKKPGKEEEIPADVKAVKQKGYTVYKNDKGCWEAKFDYGIKMVYIPAGKFTMGSEQGISDEKPVHKVFLDGYWIGKYEVTFEQYDKYCEETGKKKPGDEGWGRGDRPVINVSWFDAVAYCQWLNKKTGLNFKLPTEAQWEKAVRGTDGRTYPWGEGIDKNKCNYNNNLGRTSPAGKFPAGASPYGCLDMAGNVWEWCADWYNGNYYEKSPEINPKGPELGDSRVLRGGGWNHDAHDCRASFRLYYRPPSARWDDYGVRLSQGKKGPRAANFREKKR